MFAVRPLMRPGLFRRLFGFPEPENGYIELENLLASRPWTEIHAGHVEQALRAHGVTSMDRERARALYGKAVAAFTNDDRLHDAEHAALQCLRNLLGVRDDEAGRALEAILKRRWQDAVSDRRLSPDERQSLDALARNLGIRVDIDAATQAQLDRFHWYWLMEQGTFPEVAASIALHRGEICHFAAPAEMYEMRTETQRVYYGGPSVRIRIMKGVYYRAGSTSAHRVTRDVLRHIDSGTLYVTSKRVIFDGARKNTTIRLANVLSIVPYSDGVEVEKTSGRSPIFTVGDAEWLMVLLSSRLVDIQH